MVIGLVFSALVLFVFVMVAAYAGTLRALMVYYDQNRHSIFLPDDYEPPNTR